MKYILRNLLFLQCWLTQPHSVCAQTFLNGNFESNSANGCQVNLSNFSLNLVLPNCFAFGVGNEIDLQDTGCTYGLPSNGNWFISLSTGMIGDPDAISLELSSPLNIGNSYSFSYFERSNLQFSVTQDSLLIGVSELNNDFGIQIFSSLPDTGNWVKKVITFIAPANASFLTLKNAGNARSWNFVDNFTFDCILPVKLGNDTLLCMGKSMLLNVAQSGADYLWQDNSTLPYYEVNLAGSYWVQVSKNSCSSSDTIQINYRSCDAVEETVLEMPNVISPNGDGKNDFFRPILANGLNNPKLLIANRWGQIIKETNQIWEGWDGKINSQVCSDGTYFWVVEYNNPEGVKKISNGFFTLLHNE